MANVKVIERSYIPSAVMEDIKKNVKIKIQNLEDMYGDGKML